MKLKILELFGGIGACSKALERLGIDYEIADYVEIDKYAVKSFNAIHNTNFEPQDICKWNKDIKVDLIMHGSPCQDFSLAGKQAGGDKDSGTRSSLMYETIRIVEKLKPKYVIWENVKNLLSKKHRHNFDSYLETMEQLGYTNYYQVLNAKDYGIPQNRERVFTISILGNEKYEFPSKQDEENLQDFLEKDTNIKTKPMCEKAFNIEYEQIITSDKDIYQCNVSSGYQDCKVGIKVSPTIRANNNCTHVLQKFEFPPKQELRSKLKDMLEDKVDEKYYLSDKMVNYILDNNDTQKGTKWEGRADNDTLNSNIAHTLSVRGAGGCQRAGVSNFIIDNYEQEIKVKNIKMQTNKTICLNSKGGRNGVEGLQHSRKDRVNSSDGIAVTIATSDFYNPNYTSRLQIRKLTPKECWRLMGFDDVDFEKAEKINSNTQLYKQAGNSICVPVLIAILNNLLNN